MVKASLIALLVLLVTAPAASAAVAYVGQGDDERPPRTYTFVVYTAEPGETNRVSVVDESDGQRIRDDGASIDARSGCDQVSSHEVFCHSTEGLQVDLGDGDDSLTGYGGVFSGGDGNDTMHAGGYLRGGAGDDLLTGRAGRDDLDGGGGRDILTGAGGDDYLADGDSATAGIGPDRLDGGPGVDRVTYTPRPTGLTIDLRRTKGQGASGEGDTLMGIEDVVDDQGPKPTIATGNGRANDLNLFADHSVARGLGGNDYITAWSNLRDTLSGGPGNDYLAPSGDDYISSPDTLSCGSGRDEVALPQVPAQYVPADCELVVDANDASLRYRLLGPLRRLDAPVVRVRFGDCFTEAGDCRSAWALREEVGHGPRSAGPLLARREEFVRRNHRGPLRTLRLTRAGRGLLARRHDVRARLGFLVKNHLVGGFVIRIRLCRTLTRSC